VVDPGGSTVTGFNVIGDGQHEALDLRNDPL
jgi:hypothetical protein